MVEFIYRFLDSISVFQTGIPMFSLGCGVGFLNRGDDAPRPPRLSGTAFFLFTTYQYLLPLAHAPHNEIAGVIRSSACIFIGLDKMVLRRVYLIMTLTVM